METWGHREGVSRQEILHAVRVHMFHEDQVQLRFQIQQEREDTIICVMPKRGPHFDRGRRSERFHPGSRRPNLSSDAPQGRARAARPGPEVDDGTPSRGASGGSAPSSSTEAFYPVRPIPKKAPLPPPSSPPSFPERTERKAPKPTAVKAEPGPDYGDEPESAEPPPPPPGEYWEEYEDGGHPWYFYSGPKGQWCCQGPGKEVLPYETLNLE